MAPQDSVAVAALVAEAEAAAKASLWALVAALPSIRSIVSIILALPSILWGALHRYVLLFSGRNDALEPGRKGKCSSYRRQWHGGDYPYYSSAVAAWVHLADSRYLRTFFINVCSQASRRALLVAIRTSFSWFMWLSCVLRCKVIWSAPLYLSSRLGLY
jgi:hypothetical protein